MRAIKIQAHVDSDRTLSVRLPEDVEEGPAEVIVLLSEIAGGRPTHSLDDFLRDLSATPRETRSREEIDRYLDEERASWE